MNNTEEKNYIFGIRSIIEAVEAGKTIDKLFIQKGLHNDLFTELWKLVREKRINYKHVPLEKINRLTKKNHQGVFAFISPIDFHNIEDVVPNLYEQGKNPLVLVLDRITDVRNFGAIARTAECAGVDAIIIPEQNAAAINADAIKTSAGALHKVTVCRTWNLKLALQFMKESGIQLISCTEKTQEDIYKPNYTTPTAIIIGSEEDGVSPEFLKMCDGRAKIPMNGKIASLNVSVSTGIILYEAIRQRGKHDS
ncbi:MAG: 23S rRNA (guanosine(2251)-2'-O)-methyltransferase RlmB [Flavobacteriales bacterium]|jgi:23S rRNA (guanosine2251-2'-O)-methyltransferase|nr:23S rRNA (guanosine(2251)-2'-O)-methyltransferase RlmB [Flavobacteriales bacterium]MBT5090727.1 23S rRNA (guanosine(2251)-2'-O)-methyltransferase RlmB [Flavobacteriales bacterium]MBT5750917.1 23S rRNA (guanosine(2251)-2'-O)-methyltransferase RlmB [Flavobacteriales bacterium]